MTTMPTARPLIKYVRLKLQLTSSANAEKGSRCQSW